jgi:plastocyanin
MAFPVKYFTHAMAGVTDLTAASYGIAGDLMALFKQLLIDGFNTTVPTGMTYAAGEITVEFGVAHGYIAWQIIETSGADQSEYNGQFRVTAISATALTMAAVNGTPIPTATTATAFSCYCPPADGWEILYEVGTPTFEIHFGRTDPNATQYKYLLYNDKDWSTVLTYGNWLAKAVVVENYVDNLTFDIKNTYYIAASCAYSDTGADWLFLADKFQWYFTPRYAQNEGNYSTYTFGDINSVVKDDTGHCIFNGTLNAGGTVRWNNEGSNGHVIWTLWKNTTNKQMMTDYSGNSASVTWQMQGIHTYSANTFTYPNPASHGLHVYAGPILVCNGTTVRGHMPGLMQPLHRNNIFHQQVIDQLPGLEGVPVIFWHSSYNAGNNGDTYKRLTAWRIDDWQRDVDL